MGISVQQMQERITVLEKEIDKLEKEAKDDLGKDEAALLKRLRKKLKNAHRLLNKALAANQKQDAPEKIPVSNIDFTEIGGGEEILGEVLGNELFVSKRLSVSNSIKTWRNNCKSEIDTLVNGMKDNDGDEFAFKRGELVGFARTAFMLVGAPQIGTALHVMNQIFTISQKGFEAGLPKAPSLREVQVSWNNALDAMSDKAIDDAFDGLLAAFKKEYGYADTDEKVFGSSYRDWINYTESFAEGKLLPKSNKLKKDFLTLAFRSMPGDRFDTTDQIGTVEITVVYDAKKGTFKFDHGRIDDLTTEVKQGLKNEGEQLYGKRAMDLPAMMDFTISDGGWFNPHLCHVKRNSIKSGNTNFYLFQRSGSDLDSREQLAVYKAFMRAKPFNSIKLSDVL